MILTAGHIQSGLQQSQTLFQAGRRGEAWNAIKPLRKAIDGDGQALRLFALIAQASDEIDSAADALRRIIAIEREPPEIIGALADMLDGAGRHDEALLLWTRLTMLQPGIADAHLNRAIAATNAGKHDQAVAAADAGLARFPGHPRLMATRAMALKNAGRIVESLAQFEAAVAADPNRALTRHNHAVAFRAASRFDEACEAFATSERLGMRGAQFHANWAAAALEAGRIDQAADLYRRALADDPGHDETMQALTRLHTEYRTGEDPFGHFQQLAASRPDDPNSWVRWANALALNRDYAGAAKVAEEGVAHHPESSDLAIVAAFGAGMSGDAVAPIGKLLERLRRDPDNELLWPIIAQLGLRAGMPDKAEEAALKMVARYPLHQTAWSILALAWRVLGDEREQWLCDYERLVMTVDVAPPNSKLTPGQYAASIGEALVKRHNTLAAPGNQSLRQGTQTGGALFDDPDPAIQQFRDVVSIAAAEAMKSLPEDRDHPFLSRKASRFRFSGSWSVRLEAGGGHHVPHYHSEGWMSSAYYARLPHATREAHERQEGWIEFGRSPEIFNLDLEPRRVIEPIEGRLVLFPSYMWHGTIPFGQGERLTAAFDYQPIS